MWIFAYGSLIFRPDFDFKQRQLARAEGWARRFWQGSTDHRGVPGAPGRVVTLVPEADAHCWGMVYETTDCDALLARLDHRESGGYTRVELPVEVEGRRQPAITWIAAPDNPNYLGPAPLASIAQQVARSTGPSGPNDEYVLRLAQKLDGLGIDDPHVSELAELLR